MTRGAARDGDFTELFRLLGTSEAQRAAAAEKPFQPTWNSLRNYRTPQLLWDGKFGIYSQRFAKSGICGLIWKSESD